MLDGIRAIAEMEVSGVKTNPEMTDYWMREYPRLMEPMLQKIEQSRFGIELVRRMAAEEEGRRESVQAKAEERVRKKFDKLSEVFGVEEAVTEARDKIPEKPVTFSIGSIPQLTRLFFEVMDRPVSLAEINATLMSDVDYRVRFPHPESTEFRVVNCGEIAFQPVVYLEGNPQAPVEADSLRAVGLPVFKRSEKTSNPSTDKEALTELQAYCMMRGMTEEAEVIDAVLGYRKQAKYYGTYVKSMPGHTQADGYFHTTYKMEGTATGRHSTAAPSLHTIPKDTGPESPIRYQFISRWWKKGGVIIQADLKQAEMCVAASLSGDQNLIDTILSGVDLHSTNATRLFHTPLEQVTPKQRSIAKNAGFGVLYGQGAQGLAAHAGITVPEAEKIIKDFYRIYPGLKLWMAQEYAKAKRNGFVTTEFGRVRHLPGIEESHEGDRIWRQVVNTPIQSVASDITFLSILETRRQLIERGVRVAESLPYLSSESSRQWGFIHDSVQVDAAPGQIWSVVLSIQAGMVDYTNREFDFLKVPMRADFEFCPGWGFPLELTWEGNVMRVTGPPLNLKAARREIRAMGAVLLNEGTGPGEGDHWAEFTPMIQKGTPDFGSGKQMEIF
jgi:hypothetical protein